MTSIHIKGTISKFYPYRTAITTGWTTRVILGDDELRYISSLLSNSGYQIDNHIVFTTTDNCNYWLHDGRLCIGGTVVEETH